MPSNQARDRILTRWLPLVNDALEETTGTPCQLVILVDPTHGRAIPSSSATSEIGADAAQATAMERRSTRSTPAAACCRPGDFAGQVDEAGLNPRYTFETFVIGASNRFAHAAALRVAETPAPLVQPAVHLRLRRAGQDPPAARHRPLRPPELPAPRVRYVSTETFLNEFVDAIRNNTNTSFKRRYREVDVLLIDDIQFLEKREGLQEEFFHTFNALHGANKQIVISSDRLPDAIPTLEDRLRSRFKWGLITDIQPPDLETRLAILRKKAERDHVAGAPGDAGVHRHQDHHNIRELEGALIRVSAYASLDRRADHDELAQHLLADLLGDTSAKPRTDEELLDEIADMFGFEVDDARRARAAGARS